MLKRASQLQVGDVFVTQYTGIAVEITAIEQEGSMTVVTLWNDEFGQSTMYFGPVCFETFDVL